MCQHVQIGQVATGEGHRDPYFLLVARVMCAHADKHSSDFQCLYSYHSLAQSLCCFV